MPRSARRRSESSLYHIVCRGASKQIIFEDDDDRAYFMKRISTLIRANMAKLICWCLMDNHVHFVVGIDFERLSPMMHSLLTSYSGYFNRVHQRSGALFEGRFKSEPIESDSHLMSAFRYVHMNPVKAGLSSNPSFAWSSYDEIINGAGWVDSDYAISLFNTIENFKSFHRMPENDFHFIDTKQCSRARLSDSEARNFAKTVLNGTRPSEILSWPRSARDAALARMKEGGISVRQIQRLTGLSLGTISKAGK